MSKKLNSNLDGPVVLVSQEIRYTFPFAYAYLAGYLKQQGEDVRILFRPIWGDDSDLIKKILELKPVLVGFGSLYPELKTIEGLIAKLNECGRNFPVVIGGQMVSPIPEFALRRTKADFGVIGEGEITLFKLTKTLRDGGDISKIKGLAIREGDEVIFTGPGEFIDDLSKLPPIPYELFPQEKWIPIGRYYADKSQPHWRFNDRVIPVHGGRGCPFNCNFCYHHSKFRYRAINDMMFEAKEQLERFKGNMLYFGDDLVIFNPSRAKELVKAIEDFKKPVEYSISARFDVLERIDDDLLRAMKSSGCRIMGLGIESGSQRILDLMDKKITVEQIRYGLARLKKAGILPTVSIMVGQYSETRQDVESSIKLMEESLDFDNNLEYAFTITTPFPGSPLYSLALESGYIKSHQDFFDRYNFELVRRPWQLVVNFSRMSNEELVYMHENITKIYRRKKRALLGNNVVVVEFARKILHRGDFVLRNFVWPALPKFFKPFLLVNIYNRLYDSIQLYLDNLRLKLRDLK